MPKDQGGMASTDEMFTWYQNHEQAQTLWKTANLEGIDANHWHYPPIEFIKYFKQCDWLDSSRFYWVSLLMAQYADETHHQSLYTSIGSPYYSGSAGA